MGFFGLPIGGDDAPDAPEQVALDGGTQDMIARQYSHATKTPEEYSGILNQNSDQALTALGQSKDQLKQISAGHGGAMSNGQIQAIRGVYDQKAQQGINELVNSNDLQGKLMKADYMHKLSSALLNQQVQATNQFQFLTNAYMQQEQARAQTVNSLFQVGDQVIGMNARMAGSPTATSGLQTGPPITGKGYGGGLGERQGGFNPDAGGNVIG